VVIPIPAIPVIIKSCQRGCWHRNEGTEMQIDIPKQMLESIIGDYEYWAKQLSSVISSNKDLAHMLEYESIAEHLKSQLD